MWKQEVSQRLAAHKSHKAALPAEQQSPLQTQSAGRRANAAAARVAARFAKAPSYSQVLADEARAAVRAAEAASQAALHAHAAAQSVLASLEAGIESEHEVKSRVQEDRLIPESDQLVLQPATGPDTQSGDSSLYSIQWESELPINRSVPEDTRASHGAEDSALLLGDWSSADEVAPESGGIQIVEAAQPIHANLIEFPRELVATRKVRPRLVEGPYASVQEPGGQLSIFEVDPGTVSIQPEPAEIASVPAESVWTSPDWSSIQLDDEPEEELRPEPQVPVAPAATIELASMSRRLLATVVDISLIVGASLAASIAAASNAKALPAPRVAELLAAAALLIVAALYKVLFSTLATATPGMRYAGITLSTFTGQRATREQRCRRLSALLLSLLPVGLGVMWCVFDDEHLSWHDRLSRTYLRRS